MSGLGTIVTAFAVAFAAGAGLVLGLVVGAQWFGPISVHVKNTTTIEHRSPPAP